MHIFYFKKHECEINLCKNKWGLIRQAMIQLILCSYFGFIVTTHCGYSHCCFLNCSLFQFNENIDDNGNEEAFSKIFCTMLKRNQIKKKTMSASA